ncbi:acetyltransferase [Litorivicinus lipolyticus]|uniref:Acetyltransferase n=1 Tax=Litorivicinus lipolyticus TaxID=418701 RepID=A0A5Q2QE36_9GAMM|nr:DapH/DapD/GlmU-related protein [Litorivicinus lipolyticus]QGG80631.1 acetyltransferase [Litorivicinus lipolyticus]
MLRQLKALGITGLIVLARDLLLTKLFFRNARLVRWPFLIRREGEIFIGPGLNTGPRLLLETRSVEAKLVIGKNFVANTDLHIGVIESVTIGNNVLVASGVFISDHSHGSYNPQNSSSPETPPNTRQLVSSPVRIGDNCWIGEKVAILPGVTIGKGTIIGAGSVVTNPIPEYVIAVGNPARVIKKYDPNKKSWKTSHDSSEHDIEV